MNCFFLQDVRLKVFDDVFGIQEFLRRLVTHNLFFLFLLVCRQSSYVNIIRNIFKKIDCTSEKVNKGYFTMKVPAGKNYGPIRQKLDELETTGVIGHAEP